MYVAVRSLSYFLPFLRADSHTSYMPLKEGRMCRCLRILNVEEGFTYDREEG